MVMFQEFEIGNLPDFIDNFLDALFYKESTQEFYSKLYQEQYDKSYKPFMENVTDFKIVQEDMIETVYEFKYKNLTFIYTIDKLRRGNVDNSSKLTIFI